MYAIEATDLQQLFTLLQEQGYTMIGPKIRDGAIVFDNLSSIDDLPRGWTDVQGPASYTLARRNDDAYFGFVIGPVSWKKYLFPPRVRLFTAVKNGKEFKVTGEPDKPAAAAPKLAFIGVRPCELNALGIHDRVFMTEGYADPTYKRIRESTFIVSVNCLSAGGTCFCVSTGTGPGATEGFDLSLTEILDGQKHQFVVRAGSSRGEALLERLGWRVADASEQKLAEEVVQHSATTMGRVLDLEGVKDAIIANFEHPEWDEVAHRCLTCANCTMVCPTCFCSTVEDHTDLAGTQAERVRRWDSCLTRDFTRVAGGNTRPSAKARYRQWVSHKFAYWVDQFGINGCVGCGRCITWCPVGIDITEEVGVLRGSALPADPY